MPLLGNEFPGAEVGKEMDVMTIRAIGIRKPESRIPGVKCYFGIPTVSSYFSQG